MKIKVRQSEERQAGSTRRTSKKASEAWAAKDEASDTETLRPSSRSRLFAISVMGKDPLRRLSLMALTALTAALNVLRSDRS